MSRHICHAFGCDKSVPPRLLMCAHHWYMVPRNVQSLVWKHYRPGQEVDKMPSEEYLLVQRSAVWSVAVSEGICTISEVPEVGSHAYMIGPAILRSPKDPQ